MVRGSDTILASRASFSGALAGMTPSSSDRVSNRTSKRNAFDQTWFKVSVGLDVEIGCVVAALYGPGRERR
jgi:hypothetical protein